MHILAKQPHQSKIKSYIKLFGLIAAYTMLAAFAFVGMVVVALIGLGAL